jgi:GntR family transcriptional regulator
VDLALSTTYSNELMRLGGSPATDRHPEHPPALITGRGAWRLDAEGARRDTVMTEPTRRKTTTTRSTAKASASGDDAPEQVSPPPAKMTQAPNPPLGTGQAPDRSTAALMAKLPRYQRIAADLRARIESGELAPGQALPSETEMLTQYGVSRVTIRHAIAALRASGLVTTEHGRATRVRANVGITSPGRFEFNPTIIRTPAGYQTWDSEGWADVESPSQYRTEAARYTNALELAPGEPVFVLERQLLHVSGLQVLHRVFVPFATACTVPDLEANPFRSPGDLYEVLADAGLQLRWCDTIAAAMPTPDDAATLSIPDGVPLLIHMRLISDATARPMALEETRLSADRFSITFLGDLT